jgi:hypothetical protein
MQVLPVYDRVITAARLRVVSLSCTYTDVGTIDPAGVPISTVGAQQRRARKKKC